MPPAAILDPTTLDYSRLVADRETIKKLIPHRHEFQLLEGVVHCDREQLLCAGFHDVRADAWWARGHIPDRPLFPGVLMIEVAAQMASFLRSFVMQQPGFLGFVGAENVKFRGTVEPPSRFTIIGRGVEVRARRTVCETQGFVGATMVFEGRVIGMPV